MKTATQTITTRRRPNCFQVKKVFPRDRPNAHQASSAELLVRMPDYNHRPKHLVLLGKQSRCKEKPASWKRARGPEIHPIKLGDGMVTADVTGFGENGRENATTVGDTEVNQEGGEPPGRRESAMGRNPTD